MKLYAARHGETQWNAQNKVCGRIDLPLTEKGRTQGEALTEKAVLLDIDLILSSPMLRARQTAALVAEKCGVPVIIDDRLIEQAYGIYEGVDRKNPDFLANKRQFAYRYPGGESMMDVAHRVYGLLDEVKGKYCGKNVLLVCHGGVCRVIRTYFEDMTNEEYFQYSEENATVRAYEL